MILPSLPFRFRSNLLLALVLGPIATVARDTRADNPTSILAYQRQLAERVREVSERVLPSVVTIEVIGVVGSDGEVRQDAPTSGVIADEQGHVLTSSLVTRGSAASLIVVLPGGQRAAAKVVGRDEHRDLVLLKINSAGKELSPILWPEAVTSDSGANDGLGKPLRIGQTMIAVARYGQSGEPLVSTGILSAVDRLDGTAIQTDARVSPGFYGGPLVDLDGAVRGILIPAVGEGGGEDTASWYDSGVAFAVPASVIVQKLNRMRAGETIRQGLLGVVMGGNDPYAAGTTLSAIRTRSPAEAAGLQVGDELLSVAEKPIRRRQEMKLALGPFDAGDEVAIRYRRGDEEGTTRVKLVETIPPVQPQSLGVTLAPAEPLESALDQPSVTWKVTAVLGDGPSDGKLSVGDRVLRVDSKPVVDLASLRQRLWTAIPKTPIEVEIAAGKTTQIVSVVPRDWGGPLRDSLLSETLLLGAGDDAWKAVSWDVVPLRLTDVANEASLIRPRMDDVAPAAKSVRTGCLTILLPPATRKTSEAIEPWKAFAKEQRVAVCVIASEQEDRWRAPELDGVSKLTAAAIQQSGADPAVVAIAGEGVLSADQDAGPADSMALAVALSDENRYAGVAIAASTKPPGVRLAPDDPLRLLRVLVPIPTNDEPPTWAAALERLGCPVQRIPTVDRESLLRWVNSLRWL